MLQRSGIECEQTGLSIYRLDGLLSDDHIGDVDEICEDILQFQPDIVRIKINANAVRLKSKLSRESPLLVQYLYSIKRYTFPATTFGYTTEDPIQYQILTENDWDIFCYLLKNAWEHDFIGYRKSDILANQISNEMEYYSLLEYYKSFIGEDESGKQIWLLMEGNEYIGMCCFLEDQEVMRIPIAAISPHFRGRGYFKRLSVSGREHALEHKKPFLSNGVRTDNAISLHFFDRWITEDVQYEDVYCVIGNKLYNSTGG